MSEQKEKHVNIKFCFKPGEDGARCRVCWKRFLMVIVRVVLKSLKDSRGLNEPETRSRMISNRSDRQQQTRWSCDTCSLRINLRRAKGESTLLCWSTEATETRRFLQGVKENEISRLDSASLQYTRAHRSAGLDFLAGHIYLWIRNYRANLTCLSATCGCSPKLKWQKRRDMTITKENTRNT